MIAITRKRCPICGHLLERYPNSGEPLVRGEVCLTCNNSIVFPYRYFLSTYRKDRNAMVVGNGKIRLVRASDGTFKPGDIGLFLGKDITIRENRGTGLTFAFRKGFEKEPEDLRRIVLDALKAPTPGNVMVMPTRLMAGGKEEAE